MINFYRVIAASCKVDNVDYAIGVVPHHELTGYFITPFGLAKNTHTKKDLVLEVVSLDEVLGDESPAKPLELTRIMVTAYNELPKFSLEGKDQDYKYSVYLWIEWNQIYFNPNASNKAIRTGEAA